VCKTDLWLSAAISPLAPGRAVCPEHAAHLPGHASQRLLLFRYTPGASCLARRRSSRVWFMADASLDLRQEQCRTCSVLGFSSRLQSCWHRHVISDAT